VAGIIVAVGACGAHQW